MKTWEYLNALRVLRKDLSALGYRPRWRADRPVSGFEIRQIDNSHNPSPYAHVRFAGIRQRDGMRYVRVEDNEANPEFPQPTIARFIGAMNPGHHLHQNLVSSQTEGSLERPAFDDDADIVWRPSHLLYGRWPIEMIPASTQSVTNHPEFRFVDGSRVVCWACKVFCGARHPYLRKLAPRELNLLRGKDAGLRDGNNKE